MAGECRVDDEQRRARIGMRHGLAAAHRCADPLAVARALTALHATEAATVYLSVHARSPATIDEIDAALYDRRVLVKQLAMRRTLFAFPRESLPAVWGSAAARTAAGELRKNRTDLVRSGITDDPDDWLARAESAVLDVLGGAAGLGAARVRELIPMLDTTVTISPGTKWGGDIPLAPRVLTWLGARGLIVRGRNDGHWLVNKPLWFPVDEWLDEAPPKPLDVDAGYDELIRRWLHGFGPGTEEDLRWWLGGTLGAVRGSLRRLAARSVALADGSTGWLLPDDLDPVPEPEPWAALLPVLDPTIMGWRERSFYLDGLAGMFDSSGNAGTSAWWCGRVVGCWVQDPDGVVHVHRARDVGAEARAALDVRASELTEWLGGVRIGTIYPSPLMKQARADRGFT